MPAEAATVHGKHQPLQWNIGGVPGMHGMLAEIAGQNIADGVEIRAAVMGHDALGLPVVPEV